MKRTTIGWALIIIGVGILFFALRSKPNIHPVPAENPVANRSASSTVEINGTVIKVEIADTDALREQGLSDRTSLASDSGMLFTFDEPVRPGFWMKDMNFPLDIVWITASSTIEGVEKNLLPDTYPSVYSPSSPVISALELPAGYFDAHGFEIGMPVRQDFQK